MSTHDEDLEFIQLLREASTGTLGMILRFQCCEPWRRCAVLRELARRAGLPLPTTA